MSIGPLGTNFSEILIEVQNFSFMWKDIWKYCRRNGYHFVQGGDEIHGDKHKELHFQKHLNTFKLKS